jgi:hypothetical protein
MMPAVPPEQETGTAEHPCLGATVCAWVTRFTNMPGPARRKPGLVILSMTMTVR